MRSANEKRSHIWAMLLLSILLLFHGSSASTSTNWTNDDSTPTTTKVWIHIPVDLYNASGIPHVRGDFGSAVMVPPHSLSTHVYYVDNPLCVPFTNATEGYPRPGPTSDNNDFVRESPYLLLVPGGGGCNAVTKARHAQQAGAAAVLIGEQHCMCWDVDCQTLYNKETTTDSCQDHATRMTNDGSSGDVSIPAFLLFRPTFETMRERLQNQNQVLVMELQWQVEMLLNDVVVVDGSTQKKKKKKKPSIHYWTTAYDPFVPYEVHSNVQRTMRALSGFVELEPRYWLVNGTKMGCRQHDNVTTTNCPDLCTNGNRYCALQQQPAPPAASTTSRSGGAGGDDQAATTAVVKPMHVVEETLRRLCIWETFQQDDDDDDDDDNSNDRYWDYVLFHKQNCQRAAEDFADPKCIANALKHANLHRETSKLDSCMETAGKTTDNVVNTILNTALQHVEQSGRFSIPAIVLNHRELMIGGSSSVHPRDILEAVCNEYWYSQSAHIPIICETCGACPNTMGCLEHQKCVNFDHRQRHPEQQQQSSTKSSSSSRGRGWKVFWWLLALAVLTVIGYYMLAKYGGDGWLQRITQRRLQQRSGVLNDYMFLQSGE